VINESEETLLRLDEIDHKILARLTEHGRESFAMLGHHIGLSTAATKRRVDRLRHSGVIRRFTAEVEPAALGWTIEAFVEVYCEGRVPPDRMREMVSNIPEVAEAYAPPIRPISKRSSASSAPTQESPGPDPHWFSHACSSSHLKGRGPLRGAMR
jgi:hypothetical protein